MATKILFATFLLLFECISCHAGTGNDAKDKIEKGNVLYENEQYSEATDLYLDAMNMAKKQNDVQTYVEGLFGLGNVYVRMDDIERAMYYLQRCYEKSKEIDDKVMQGKCVTFMASCSGFVFNLPKARHYYGLQKKLPHENEDMKQFYLFYNGALISYLEGNTKQARKQFHLAADCAVKHRLKKSLIQSIYGLLVYVQLKQNNISKALQYCEKYKAAAHNDKKNIWQEAYYEMLHDVYKAANKTDIANIYKQKADSTFKARITRQQIKAIDNKVVKFENKHNKEDINKLSNTISRQRLFIIVCISFVLILTILVSVIVIKSRRLKHAYILVIAKNRELAIANNMSKKLRNKAVTGNMPAGSNDSTESKERDRETENKQEEETTETKAPITANEISLTPEQTDKILQGVIMTMENVDIISKPSFTLVELAKMINSNTRYVSWVINNTYNKNFKTLLNEYRIREVCRRMEDNKNFGHLTIQAIYTSLGYSSASNFLRAFKNVNGMTPSTYQKLINENRKAIKHTEENQ